MSSGAPEGPSRFLVREDDVDLVLRLVEAALDRDQALFGRLVAHPRLVGAGGYGSAFHVLVFWHIVMTTTRFGGPVDVTTDDFFDVVLGVVDLLDELNVPLSDAAVRDCLVEFVQQQRSQPITRGDRPPTWTEAATLAVSVGLHHVTLSDEGELRARRHALMRSQVDRVAEHIRHGTGLSKDQISGAVRTARETRVHARRRDRRA